MKNTISIFLLLSLISASQVLAAKNSNAPCGDDKMQRITVCSASKVKGDDQKLLNVADKIEVCSKGEKSYMRLSLNNKNGKTVEASTSNGTMLTSYSTKNVVLRIALSGWALFKVPELSSGKATFNCLYRFH